MKKDILANPKNVKFIDLLQICIKYFGNPRISGSHHIFKMPWQGDPRINIQKDGNMAKEYQVKAVMNAIEKLQLENNKPEEKNHGKK
ncbi:hypothetical protein FACS1894106_0360 [Spirochaetia bacterium]|nr:hypothetical protein FACS1894106_0360 [Spirochaetia bacterium]